MAQQSIKVAAAGSGQNVDFNSLTTSGNYRQTVSIGDPSTDAGVAPVDATKGLRVDLTNTGANTTALKVDGSAVTQPVSGTLNINALPAGTNTIGSVKVTDGTHTATVSVGGAVLVDASATTQPVSGTVTANAGTGTFTVSGTVNTNADGTTGTAVPSKGLLVQGSDGTNSRNLSTTTAGVLKVDVSATTANTTALKVDGSGVTQPVSISGNQAVNLAQVAGASIAQGHGTAASAIRVELPTDGTGVVGLNAGTNTIGNTGNVPLTSGGLTTYRLLAAASTNGNNIKNAAGQIYGYYITNTSAAMKYVKFYNKATAPTVGTDTPVITIGIPATSAANVFSTQGVAFGTGIGIGITGAVADNDTTAVSANDVVVNLFYA